MTVRTTIMRCAIAAVPFSSGCPLLEEWHDHHGDLVDASHADAGDAVDGGLPCDAAVDGGFAGDAAVDSGLGGDGGLPGDGGSDDAGARCASDLACSADAYCARATGLCTPRCAADGICVGPEVADVDTRLVTDGETLCFSANDLAGGTAHKVRAWDGVAEHASVVIGSGTAVRLFLVADGYCYYAAPELKRARLAGGAEETLLDTSAPAQRAWLSAEHVWWVAPVAGGLGVYRIARTEDAAVELFATVAADQLWEAGNSSYLVRRVAGSPGCTLVLAPIADLTAEQQIPMTYSFNCLPRMIADEQSLFYPQYRPVNHHLYRLDFADLSQQLPVGLFSTEPLHYQLRGAWIYGQTVRDGGLGVPGANYNVTYFRVPRSSSGATPEQLFAPVPGSSRHDPYLRDDGYPFANTFAALEDKLVYLSASEPRLLVTAIATAP